MMTIEHMDFSEEERIMRKVEVVSYNPEWQSRFEEEAGKLRRLFEGELVAIHHIGSTSVEGLAAKPIIDMMPVVRDIERVDAYTERMEALGYRGLGEYSIPKRRYFRKGEEERTVHVHVFEEGNPDVVRHLAFRDYLRTFPEVRDTYGELKLQLATQHPEDMEGYIQGKHEWIIETERLATKWYKENHGV